MGKSSTKHFKQFPLSVASFHGIWGLNPNSRCLLCNSSVGVQHCLIEKGVNANLVSKAQKEEIGGPGIKPLVSNPGTNTCGVISHKYLTSLCLTLKMHGPGR